MTTETDKLIDMALQELPEFTQQDDYLLAYGASLMSENSHEIVHLDTVTRIVKAVRAAILADAAKGVEPVAYQRLVAGKWEACTYFVAIGWGDMPTDGSVRALVPAATVAGLQARIADLERANAEHENRRANEACVEEALADRVAELESDRDSWRDQASARVADAVQFAQERDEARAQLLAARADADRLGKLVAQREADAEYWFKKSQAEGDKT